MNRSVSAADVVYVRPAKTNPLVKLAKVAKNKPLGAVAAFIIVTMIVLAIFAPVVAPYNPFSLIGGVRLTPPSWQHWMGTDDLGRDVLSRIIYGSRVSLRVGFVAVSIAMGIGVFVGVTTGYYGGKIDLLSQRLIDAIQALPGLVLALTIVVVLGSKDIWVIVAISVVIFPGNARVVRGAVLATKSEMYVDAARAMGATHSRIMLKHILPNVMAPIIILSSLLFGGAILIEASLSFLGLGTQPPTPSWGGMLNGAGRQYMERVPTLAIFPGLAISIAVLSFNLLGDTLRDILDPRLRGGR